MAVKVSIGMPVWNGEKFLVATLNSLRDQSFGDYELIISDNASTDLTQEICQNYSLSDSRIRYYRNDVNIGAGPNFNRVLALANGQYFKWAAHDDLCKPNYLKRCIDVLDADARVVLCQSRVRTIDQDGKIIENSEIGAMADSSDPSVRFYYLLQSHMCYEIFGVIRRNALNLTMGMGNFPHGDGVLLAWLGLLGRFHEIPEYLFYSRRHPSQAGSRLANRREWASWFDPMMAGRIVFPHWRILREYLRAINSSSLSRLEAIHCYGYLGRWIFWYRKKLLGNLVSGAAMKRVDQFEKAKLRLCSECDGKF